MINFRYHVVSLTAVFLALAVGLILGTAALNGPVADNLNSQVSSLGKTNADLRANLTQLRSESDSQADFVRDAAPMLLDKRLAGRSVLLVTTDTTDSKVRDSVTEMLKKADATVTGRLRVNAAYTDPRNDDKLQDLATRLVPAGVTLPPSSVGVETASALLATVVVEGGPVVTEAKRREILTGFSSLGSVTVEAEVTEVADAVVVLYGQSAVDEEADRHNAAMLTILSAFDRIADNMVLAAPQAGGDGNPIGAVRGDDSLAKQISTVDNVASIEGQVVAALALAEQFAAKKTGHYGSGNGSSARVPTLASQ